MERELPAPADFGTDVIGVTEGQPMSLRLRLESVVEGILVTGDIRAEAVGACVRCLDPVTTDVEARMQELFAYADRAEHHRAVGASDDESDEHIIVDGLINLEPVLRDVVVPTLPFTPVCRADCLGLCVDCGARMEDDPGHVHEVVDPRWAALTALATETETTDN